MQNTFRRAIADTRRSFDLTIATIVRSVVVPVAAVLLMAAVRGFEHAVNEAADIVLYVLAAGGAAVIPVFLWNLWLAPYRLMHERLDKAIADGTLPSQDADASPDPANISAYANTTVYRLEDAACLWVGLEPHKPITDPAALAMRRQLGGAMAVGQLAGRYGLTPTLMSISGRSWWPEHDHAVSAVALRQYADALGDVPAFLESVQVPAPDAPDPRCGGSSEAGA